MNDRSPSTSDDDALDPPPGGPDQVAAGWVIRRGGEDWTAQDDAALRIWLQADATHAAAFARAERTWAELAGLKQAPELLAPAGESVAAARPARGASSAAPIRPLPRPRRGGAWRHVLGGAALATMAVVAVLAATGGEPMLAFQADVRTAVGETRAVALPDGSRVRLGADTAIAVHYDADQRRVELLKGEALFEALPVRRDAADGERRPFVVTAAAGATRALGTRFLVERLATHTRVTGVEHQVAVTVDTAPKAAAILSPGQAVRYDARGVSPVDTVAPEVASASERGLLVFDHAELADVVARLNRHHVGHITVRGDALAQRQVSGVFPAQDIDGALAAIQAELGVRVLRLPGVTVLY